MRRIQLAAVAVATGLLVAAMLFVIAREVAAASGVEAQQAMAVVAAFNEARETCYSAPDCPNLDALMAMFTSDARRTEIQRNNNVVLLEGPEALRADNLRVASTIPGRRLETTSMMTQGRNVIVLQLNWDPGATEPNPFTSVFRIQDGKAAHWVLVAP